MALDTAQKRAAVVELADSTAALSLPGSNDKLKRSIVAFAFGYVAAGASTSVAYFTALYRRIVRR